MKYNEGKPRGNVGQFEEKRRIMKRNEEIKKDNTENLWDKDIINNNEQYTAQYQSSILHHLDSQV